MGQPERSYFTRAGWDLDRSDRGLWAREADSSSATEGAPSRAKDCNGIDSGLLDCPGLRCPGGMQFNRIGKASGQQRRIERDRDAADVGDHADPVPGAEHHGGPEHLGGTAYHDGFGGPAHHDGHGGSAHHDGPGGRRTRRQRFGYGFAQLQFRV